MPRRLLTPLLVVLVGLTAACGSSTPAAHEDGKKAAEPATSPALSATPAGTGTKDGVVQRITR